MDLNCVRRITLKAADLDAEPATSEELDFLRKKLESVRKGQREAKAPDYSKYSKEKVIQILQDREKDHKKVETFYRSQVDELEAELSDARELIISLIDERNEIDLELSQVRKQRQELKSQVQGLELDLSKKSLEKDELLHNFDLAHKQIHRFTQQLQEEQQKIEILNIQNQSLQELLSQEQSKSKDFQENLAKSLKEEENLNKVMEEMQGEMNELMKHKEFSENMTDKKLQDAITSLSMIILAKDKTYTLTPEQRYLIKQVFGENCSKLIENSENKQKELGQKHKALRENYTNMANLADTWLNEFISLAKWLEGQNLLLLNGDFDESLEEFAGKMPELSEKCRNAGKYLKDPEAALILAARLSVKDKEDSITSGRPLYGSINSDEFEKIQKKLNEQRKELEELRGKLHNSSLLESRMREEISELNNFISSLKKNAGKIEAVRFLQCQASMIEDLIKEETIEE